jgi:hypothetical protein
MTRVAAALRPPPRTSLALLTRLLRLELDAITSDSPHELRAALGGAGAFAVAA